jgi:hypothetical protein
MKLALTLASLSLAVAASAFAGPVDVRVHSTGTPPEFISGTGIRPTNFTQSTGSGVTVAVKPRNRDPFYGGEANFIRDDNYYSVQPGQSAINVNRPQLAFDFQFDPGTDAVTNYVLQLDVDFDPTPGVANFSTTKMAIQGGWSATDGYFLLNSRKPVWNDVTVPYIVSNTTILPFLTAPAGAPAYNSSTLGEYEIRLTAFAADGTTQLAQAAAFAVVPEPTTLAAIAGASTLLVRRRRA